jgi:hypothetical protein
LRKERAMSKKRLLCGMMVLMFLCWGTAAHALVPRDAEHPDNPDPGTCVVFPFVGVITQPFPMTFALILQNYLGSTQTFSVNAFIGGTILRVRTITLDPDRFVGLGPADIPILNGELADVYVCWPVGGPAALVPPGALLFLAIGTSFLVEPSVITFGF